MGEICGTSSSLVNKAKPFVLMVALQFLLAGTVLFAMTSAKHGVNRFVFSAYRNAFAALSLAPFAFFLDRKVRPKMTISVFLQIMLLGLLEPVVDQGFTFLGMQYTSAAFTSAIINTVPSLTFVLAIIFRLERLRMREAGSRAKVVGTMVTFGGALLMTLYKGPIVPLFHSATSASKQQAEGRHDSPHKHWLIGTLFLLLGCAAWSCFFILQSITVKKYPAELSLACLICLVGSLQSGVAALISDHHPGAWSLGWDYRLFSPLYAGIAGSGIAYYVQGLVLQTKGPVFVTAFYPLCMVIVAALSSFLLSEQLHLGSIIGGMIIAVGLYCVVWGKGKDELADPTPPATVKESAQELPVTSMDTADKPIYYQTPK
ncbi:WAT1-related protein At4g08290-like isoform X2 [Neltuma alba]|uniref:WAT1-related protein At4g08290-like isoform X2 n=1 Tax=Neltuma alba TaxID=207710 RepID=UPI0010A414E2|nr:WAT1-related protein At4g08290-like isoform X2 [Prosopis alba]